MIEVTNLYARHCLMRSNAHRRTYMANVTVNVNACSETVCHNRCLGKKTKENYVDVEDKTTSTLSLNSRESHWACFSGDH